MDAKHTKLMVVAIILTVVGLMYWVSYSALNDLELKTLMAVSVKDMTLGHIVGLIVFAWVLFRQA